MPEMREYRCEWYRLKAPTMCCLFCDHCTDVLWDYWYGPYMFASDMARDYDGDRRLLRKLVGELMPTARIAAQHGINVGKLADQERRARKLGVEVDDG